MNNSKAIALRVGHSFERFHQHFILFDLSGIKPAIHRGIFARFLSSPQAIAAIYKQAKPEHQTFLDKEKSGNSVINGMREKR